MSGCSSNSLAFAPFILPLLGAAGAIGGTAWALSDINKANKERLEFSRKTDAETKYKKYKDIFGIPGTGLHATRIPILDIALIDTVFTII